jgi:hypothetical protein
MVSDRLKQLIFKQLYKELGNVEIIPYNDSIWFIDREEKYWYFDFENSGALYWRYGFFPNFFEMFSLEREDFEPILASWVEEVLNSKVSTNPIACTWGEQKVEEVLNHRVSSTVFFTPEPDMPVEEVLNHRVSTTIQWPNVVRWEVGDVLNHKSFTKIDGVWRGDDLVEEILNENPTE